MQDLHGRVAVVTGAASGLGLAMAQQFATAGMRVVLSDIDASALERVADGMAQQGHEVRGVVTDVSSGGDVERLATETLSAFGAVHVVCNNAGVVKSARAWDLTVEDWRWVLDVDLWSVIHGIRAFVPLLLAQGEGGHIVNTASMAGLLPMPRLAAYATAKAGVIALSESLQLDLSAVGSDVGVSVFCPGFIRTRITESARNRPSSLAATAATTGPRTVEGVEPQMTADEAAAQVLDAVTSDRFWVLTHSAYRPVIAERAAGVGTDRRPVAPPVW